MSLKNIASEINGNLEISTYRGRKILDGATVNLSFGSVHRIWKAGLRSVDLSNIHKVLLLGLGGGSVVDILRKDYHYEGHITAIELDPVMIRIARDEFGISKGDKQQIKNDNAFHFIHKTRQRYDLIITDVFIESKVAGQVFEPAYWGDIKRILNPGGSLLLNVSTSGKQLSKCRKLMKQHSDFFRFKLIEKAGGSNTLLMGVLK